MEPRASPSGPRWQASARDGADRMAATARSRSSLVPGFIPRVQSLQELFDPPTTGYTSIHQERKLRCPFEAGFPGHVALELDPVVLERLPRVLGAGRVEDDGVAQ